MEALGRFGPLKILEKTTQKELGKGNLGILIARAGVGKTACLIHIAFHNLFQGKKLVHVSLKEGPDKIMSYYNVMYADLLKALNITDDHEYHSSMDRDRMILAYLNRSFDPKRLRTSMRNLAKELEFQPNTLIIDGLDFENTERARVEGIREIASEFNVEVWFSALSHRHITEVNERGIPYPCHRLDDLFSIIMQLHTGQSGVFLRLLKEHNTPTIHDVAVRLDPSTFLAMD